MVQCPSCGSENPDNVLFCGFCGAKLERICRACGSANPAQFRFCGQCGEKLSVERPPEELASVRAVSDIPLSAVERRQITILFADLVGSTRMSRSLDPEDLRELISKYRDHVAEAVLQAGGEIARYMGDGILAYFGYPAAHENDAARAIHAALEMVHRISAAGGDFERLYAVRPQLRIGIDTGVVVAGDLASGALFERMSVVGDTPNIAARLQELARPDSIVVGPTTARLVSRYFRIRSLGQRRLKGLDEEIEVFEIAQSAKDGEPFRSDEPFATGFYGRAQENRLIWERWLSASIENQGQIVVIEGDPGIGKSRLVRELGEQVRGSAHAWIDLLGSPFAMNSPFAPVSQALRREMDRQENADRAEERHGDPLRRVLDEVATTIPEAVALVSELLDMPEERGPVADWSPRRRRQRLLEVLVAWVTHSARAQAVIMAIEDIHWMDPSTQEFVSMLVRQAPGARLLLVVTHRPDFSLDWLAASNITVLRLQPLAADEVDAMIQEIAVQRALPAEIVRAIAQKADGVPLYVEELTRTLLDRGLAAIIADLDTLPDTLRDSLMERLDRLPSGRAVVQAASVIGRTFDFDDLRLLVDTPPEELTRTLDAVVASGVLLQRGFPPAASYVFKHSLIRDAAYDSLLLRRRREIHGKLAHALEQRVAHPCPPELVAYHFSAAGVPERAFPLFMRAGHQAHAEGALQESVAHFDAAGAELRKLKEGQAPSDGELQLQIARGAVLLALKGYGAPDVRTAYERAMELSEAVEDHEASYATLWGLSSYFTVAGPADLAREIADRTISTAVLIGDPFRHAEACRRRGLIAFVAGEFRDAAQFYATAHELLARIPDPDAALFGTRPNALLRNNTAWLSWFTGRPAEAMQSAREAIEHARALGDQYALVFALGVAAAVSQHSRRPDLTRAFAAECVELSNRQLFSYWAAWGKIFCGWGEAAGGNPLGLEQIKTGLDEYRATGATQLEACALTLLADALLSTGDADSAAKALQVIDADKPGTGSYFLAETWRVAAAVSHARREPREAILAKIDRAVDIARQQGATTLELRAIAWRTAHLPGRSREDMAILHEMQARIGLERDSFDQQLLTQALAAPQDGTP